MKRFKRQSGVALVTALLVVSIAVVLAASLVDQLHLDIRRSENLIHSDQAYTYAISLEEFVKFMLKLDLDENTTKDFDDNQQLFMLNTNLLRPLVGGQMIGELVDLQSRFNLNNLSKTNANYQQDLQRFQKLLGTLELDENLAYAVVDWLDGDQIVDNPAHGAEFDYYIGLETPYRSADSLMSSPSELRLIKGFNKDDIYDTIIEHIATLPEPTSININTASPEVIESLQGIESADVDKILDKRDGDPDNEDDGDPFEKQGDFKNYMTSLGKKNFSDAGTTVLSNYFLLTTEAEVGNGKITLYSVLYRDDKGNISVINRSQGAW